MIFDGAGIGLAQTLRTMSPSTSPSNGRRPVIAANVHAPTDQRSVSGPGAPPTVSCSGAMKFGVPMTVPSRVGPPIRDDAPSGGSSSNILAMPKSTSLTTYGSPSTGSSVRARKMLSGFRSR